VDLGAWLPDLELKRYAASFEANAIDSEVLSELTQADWRSSAERTIQGRIAEARLTTLPMEAQALVDKMGAPQAVDRGQLAAR
jgi:SAM domain (Sterile alpha motif)